MQRLQKYQNMSEQNVMKRNETKIILLHIAKMEFIIPISLLLLCYVQQWDIMHIVQEITINNTLEQKL